MSYPHASSGGPAAAGTSALASAAGPQWSQEDSAKDAQNQNLLEQQPCDRCRARRKFCTRGQPCRRCARSNVACSYHLPKRKNDAAARRLREWDEARHGDASRGTQREGDALQHGHAPQTAPPVDPPPVAAGLATAPHGPALPSGSAWAAQPSWAAQPAPWAAQPPSWPAQPPSWAAPQSRAAQETWADALAALVREHDPWGGAWGRPPSASEIQFNVSAAPAAAGGSGAGADGWGDWTERVASGQVAPADFSDTSSVSAASAASAASEPVGALDLEAERARLARSMKGVVDWMTKLAIVHIPDASEAAAASPAGARAGARAQARSNAPHAAPDRGAVSLVVPQIALADWGIVDSSVRAPEHADPGCAYAPAASVPADFRRVPREPGAIAALQGGKQAFLFCEDPRSPGWHAPPELRERPLPVGQSVFLADPAGSYVLFFDAEGTIQAAPPISVHLDSRALFQAEWSTTGPGGRRASPPWQELSRDGNESARLWPVQQGGFAERDYAELLARAQRLLAGELAAQLIDDDGMCRRLTHRWSNLLTNGYLRALVGAQHAGRAVPHGWTLAQARHRAALLLALAAGPPQRARQRLTVTLGGVFDPDAPVELSATLTKEVVAGWEYADACIKLSWALLTPRDGTGHFDEEELTLDAMLALQTFLSTQLVHPHYISTRKVVWRLQAAPSTHAAMMADIAGDELRLEIHRRALGGSLQELIAFRLWRDHSYAEHLGRQYRALGDLRLAPGERFWDEPYAEADNVGKDLVLRHSMWLWRWEDRLAVLNEEVLDSKLLANDSPATEDLQDKIDEAGHFLAALRHWYDNALDSTQAEGGAIYHKEVAERLHGNWAFCYDPHYLAVPSAEYFRDLAAVSIELVLAALERCFPSDGESTTAAGSSGSAGASAAGSATSTGSSPASAFFSAHAQLREQAEAVKQQWRAFKEAVPAATKPGLTLNGWTSGPGFSTQATAVYGRAARMTMAGVTPPAD